MKTLSSIRATIRELLNDGFVEGSEVDFSEDKLDLYIQEVIAEISQRRPYEVKETLTTTAKSKELDISTIEDLLEVDKIEFKTGQDPPGYRNCSIFGNTLTMEIDFLPGAGETVYLYCHELHQLTEALSTLSPELESLVVTGAVAKAATGWINEVRKQVAAALSGITNVNTAISSMSARITQAIADLTTGRTFIAKKNTEAITAIGNMTTAITQATTDLTSGRALIGSNKTQVETALGNISAQITQAITDLTSGRAQIDDERTTADTAIDSVDARITQALADLTSGRALINKVNIGGAPESDYGNYASRELQTASGYLSQARSYLSEGVTSDRYGNYAARDLQTARAYVEEARGYMVLEQLTTEYGNYAARQLNLATSSLNQARGYLDVDRPANEYANYAIRELSNATAYLNQAGGYSREITSRLNITRTINSYRPWANERLTLYLQDLRRIARPRTYRRYPTS